MAGDEVLAALSETLADRRRADPERSYVAALHRDGLDAILRKLTEESTETVLAARNGERAAVVREVADWWFHSLVLLSHLGGDAGEVLDELRRRQGTSGLVEKARRNA